MAEHRGDAQGDERNPSGSMTESPNRDTSNDSEGMSMTIDELIEALGKLSGPDREMDLAINQFVMGWKVEQSFVNPEGQKRPMPSVPRYTESIDAALTLAENPLLVLLQAVTDCIGLRFVKKECGGSDGLHYLVRRICVHALRARQSPHGG